MKKNVTIRFLFAVAVAVAFMLDRNAPAQGQKPESAQPKKSEGATKESGAPSKPAASAEKPLPIDPEERFKTLFTKAVLSGRWAPLKDGELGEERTGDKYTIASAAKGSGDNWTVNVKMKYRDQEIVMPIPVQMKFSGDAAILTVDNLAIPGGGT